MARNSDSTHAKNLENLQVAINIVDEIGESYRPANPIIAADALREFRDRFELLLSGVSQTLPVEPHAYDEREGVYARAQAVKAYCETVLDRADSRLRTLRRLKFRKLR